MVTEADDIIRVVSIVIGERVSWSVMSNHMKPMVMIIEIRAAGAIPPRVASVMRPRFSSDPPQRISRNISLKAKTGPLA